MLRDVDALNFHEEHGESMPADWSGLKAKKVGWKPCWVASTYQKRDIVS